MVRAVWLVVLTGMLAGCGQQPVAVIDLDAVARALGRDDVIQQRISAANEQLSNQLLGIARDLQGQVQERQAALGEDASEEERAAAAEQLAAANEQLRQTQALARQRSAEFRVAVVNQFRQEVAAVAQRVATAQGAGAVLTMGAGLLWFDPAVDITDEVIAELRAGGGVSGGSGGSTERAAEEGAADTNTAS